MLNTGPDTAVRHDGSIKSMKKMLRVLECFSSADRRLTPSEIARRAQLPRATAHRIIQTLRQIGFLDQARERDEYRLGLKLFELGNLVAAHTNLHRAAFRVAAPLARVTGDVVHLSLFDGAQVVIINRFLPDCGRLPTADLPDTAPMHCSASGKAILAFQPEATIRRIVSAGLVRMSEHSITDPELLQHDLRLTQERGFATDSGELRSDLRAVAAPIRDVSGRAFAALSLCGPAAQMQTERLAALAGAVREDAARITAQLAVIS